MIELSFDDIKYGSCPQNYGLGDLPIEYELRLFPKLPIDFLTSNIIERLKVGSVEQSFYNKIYEINPQNNDFD